MVGVLIASLGEATEVRFSTRTEDIRFRRTYHILALSLLVLQYPRLADQAILAEPALFSHLIALAHPW